MTDEDSDDSETIEVVSKFKTVQHKLLPVNLPLHPLWHYYEVMLYAVVGPLL